MRYSLREEKKNDPGSADERELCSPGIFVTCRAEERRFWFVDHNFVIDDVAIGRLERERYRRVSR